MKLFSNGLAVLFAVSILASCNLDEELNDTLTREQAEEFLNNNTDVASLLEDAYRGMEIYHTQDLTWMAMEHTGDQVMGPTRGPDWDDNGVWRVLHNHQWAEDHAFLQNTFNGLLNLVFRTTNILTFEASEQEKAEARFLRAFVVFTLADGWGQVPFRDGETLDNLLLPPDVLSGAEAVDLVISELEEIIPQLPDGPANVANKDAARALLMKALLNREIIAQKVINGAINDKVINPGPEFFPLEAMNRVIALAEEIEMSPRGYELADGLDYFTQFAADNSENPDVTENIFTGLNVGGASTTNIHSRWMCTLHYNQNPSGWNGFTTLSDFYQTFDTAKDVRFGADYPGVTSEAGIRVGLLVGQQFAADGTPLEDRRGNPLVFTPEVDLRETGDDLETRGIRVVKYPIDYNNPTGNPNNDYVFLRYADVLLMKAEAYLRSNRAGDAMMIVDDLRAKRSRDAADPLPSLGSLDLDLLLEERGRELYWEGHRRTDLIRFGKFIEGTWDDKDQVSEPHRLLFPIPPAAVSVNPNLTQNPGYGGL